MRQPGSLSAGSPPRGTEQVAIKSHIPPRLVLFLPPTSFTHNPTRVAKPSRGLLVSFTQVFELDVLRPDPVDSSYCVSFTHLFSQTPVPVLLASPLLISCSRNRSLGPDGRFRRARQVTLVFTDLLACCVFIYAAHAPFDPASRIPPILRDSISDSTIRHGHVQALVPGDRPEPCGQGSAA